MKQKKNTEKKCIFKRLPSVTQVSHTVILNTSSGISAKAAWFNGPRVALPNLGKENDFQSLRAATKQIQSWEGVPQPYSLLMSSLLSNQLISWLPPPHPHFPFLAYKYIIKSVAEHSMFKEVLLADPRSKVRSQKSFFSDAWLSTLFFSATGASLGFKGNFSFPSLSMLFVTLIQLAATHTQTYSSVQLLAA